MRSFSFSPCSFLVIPLVPLDSRPVDLHTSFCVLKGSWPLPGCERSTLMLVGWC